MARHDLRRRRAALETPIAYFFVPEEDAALPGSGTQRAHEVWR
jgi:hypothetical protein